MVTNNNFTETRDISGVQTRPTLQIVLVNSIYCGRYYTTRHTTLSNSSLAGYVN